MYRDVITMFDGDWRKELKFAAVAGVMIALLAHLLMLHPRINWGVVRIVVSFAAWGVVLGGLISLTARAVMTVAREREKGTLEALILTGLGCREILRQKWLGCVLFHRPMVGFLGGVMAACLMTFTMHPVSVLCLLALLPAHVVFVASLGLYFSVQAKTVTGANLRMWPALGAWMLGL